MLANPRRLQDIDCVDKGGLGALLSATLAPELQTILSPPGWTKLFGSSHLSAPWTNLFIGHFLRNNTQA